LNIDDDPQFRTYVRRVGEAAGFETVVTGDPEVFRARLRSWDPSVILVDLNMPEVDGIEILRDVAKAKSGARVIIASGVDARILEAAQLMAAECGLAIAGVLRKPIRAAALRGALERLGEIERPLLASELADAIGNDHLRLEYQPKLDCKTGGIVGVEALARWQHPTRGIVPPDQFISLAEQSGVIHELTEWVFNTATRQAAAWRREGVSIGVAINISAQNLENIKLPDLMCASCRTAGIAPDAVTLELTESAAMGDPVQTVDVLTRLRLKGFRLAIDDFGIGYSSLVKLQKLPFSELKIDRSFVTPMMRNDDCRVIVEAVVGLAQKLGLSVVAEGVETADTLSSLLELGVDAAQGYFISRPVQPDRVGEIVRAASEGLAWASKIILSGGSKSDLNSLPVDRRDRRRSGRRNAHGGVSWTTLPNC
jgi:EAL domain-containing protein (putative c-di-GMP-specific phosphodiesterase class I)/ActR/RegA family two-component response regulator